MNYPKGRRYEEETVRIVNKFPGWLAIRKHLSGMGDAEDIKLIMKKGDGFLIQVRGFIKCNETNEMCWQKGGKRYVSSHAMHHEVVNHCIKACLDWAEHEVREAFKFKGSALYHPHQNVDELSKHVLGIKPVARRMSSTMKSDQDIDM